MKVIITGGAGFIGGTAVQHFVDSGDEVLNIDKLTYAGKKENVTVSSFVKLDICSSDSLFNIVKDYKPDCIVHFAAETHVDNSISDCKEFIHTNVEGTASVLDVCRRTKTKLCHISTDEVYGPAFDKPFTEDDRLNPMNPYSATKAAADMMIQAYRNTYGIEYLIVRPSNNYGPGQHKEKFIPKLLDCIINKKEFPLYGAGDQEREWTYVKDTAKRVRNLLTCHKTTWNSIYNLSSGITLTNIDAAQRVISLYNEINGSNVLLNEVVKTSDDRPGHDKKYWISSKKLNDILGNSYTKFDTGLREIIKNNF
jgi:dTDP-glucose 4,6-dehydratase